MNTLSTYLRYFTFLLKHKWHVFNECRKYGIVWRGIIHDWTKFLPYECTRYARATCSHPSGYNYGLTKSGFMDLSFDSDPEFYLAVARHKREHRHHWEFWVVLNKNSEIEILPMDHVSIIEMVCDWVGAAGARNTPYSFLDWYTSNKEKILLHPDTRYFVEELLELYRIERDTKNG